MPGSAFTGDPVLPFIRRWIRQCCVIGGDHWCSLVELRMSYESFCQRMQKPEQYIKHDILPVLAQMGCRLQYGDNPGAYGVRLKEVCPD